MEIYLQTIENVKIFNTSCTNYFEGEIVAKQGKFCVDAKSMLGLLSLDLLQPIYVEIQTNNKEVEQNFYNYIRIWKNKE